MFYPPPRFVKIVNFVEHCGLHSFSIMAFHLVGFRLANYLYYLIGSIEWAHIADTPIIEYDNLLYFVVYVLSGLFVPIVIVMFWEKVKPLLKLHKIF